MTKNRWMIPATFGAICVVLAIVSAALSKKGVVKQMEEGFKVGESHTWHDLALDKDKRYTLLLKPTSGVSLNSEVLVSAALLKDDAPVFEIEDAYWHQRGTWNEGGESGSWEEQNSSSEFSFVVPETGTYDFEMGVDSATSIAGDRLQAQLIWRAPFPLSMWPLLGGGLLLFGVAGWAHTSRRAALGKILEQLGEGSRIRIGEDELVVLTRMEHWEERQRVGVEFRLRDKLGAVRWLAVDRFWREHPYNEDSEQILVQVLTDVPLTPAMLAELDTQSQTDEHIVVGDEAYWRDRENGGHATLVTFRDGTPYQSRYHVDVFRDQQHFPIQPGDIWLECVQWRDTGELEWSKMAIAETDDIDVIEAKIAPYQSFADIFEQGPAQSDPFGVAQMRGQQGAAGSTSQAEHERKQEQPHDWNA